MVWQDGPQEHHMARVKKIYLAGPDVFLPDAITVGQQKKELCKRYGFEGLFPFDSEAVRDAGAVRADMVIFRANAAMIRQADLGIFNLTPFRGPSADVGTVFELGMMIGLEKPAFAYTNDAAALLDRMNRSGDVSHDPNTGDWRDSLGMLVEDFGNADNLMIDMALIEQSHPIIRNAALPEERFSDFAGFEACLRHAAEVFSTSARR
jgi:nucleoside 2-deoxyribosyltransferase